MEVSLVDKARSYAEATSKAMGKILSAVETIKAPLDAISTSIDYVESLSGTLAKAIQGCCDSFVAVSRKVTARKGKSRASVATLVSDLSTMLAETRTTSPDICSHTPSAYPTRLKQIRSYLP